ncbi:uncharacterized protein LOC134693740 [Mytilus trossulus]|uniref:uncharacterized protein LOC134693740 n=1 Tax=Mytilus trossulus TaxID=6551 RepID=UPI0030070367
MRLSAKSDVNIRIMAISREDLNMYTEIAKTVLRNVDLLKSEINTILSGMLSEVAIDTKEVADVLVNLTVPDVQSERKSEEKTEQIDQLSAIHDEQERTIELSEELSSDKYPLQLKTSLLCKINVPVIKGSQIIDCVIIGKLFVFVDLTTKRLIIHQTDGRHKEDITLPDDPRGLTAINNTDVAVLYNESYIEIISIDTGRVQNAIRTRSDNKGISYQKGLLFIHFHDKFIIDGIDLKGEIIQSTSYQTSPGSLSLQYVSTATDRLFFTGGFILYCCDWFGAILWKFTDEMMKFPEGVITDEMGNVYVGSYGYNNVIVISPDGKHYKELLTRKDGILKPRAMYYDKSSHCLLVCNERNGQAFLFDVYE